MPDLFGTTVMTETVLPLGFQSKTLTSEDVKCDLPNCSITDEQQPWSIFKGCGHSFHDCCVDDNYCPICKQFLNRKIQELGKTIQDGIFDTGSQPNIRECVDPETDEETDEDTWSQHGPHGSIIATCPSGCVQDFVNYISSMAREVWNTSLQGSNLAILE